MRETQVPVIGFVAASGSGKTTLLTRLVPVLRRRGLRLGYLKHAHHGFDLDVPGKDSYELRSAGAVQTLIASRERWALQSEQPEGLADPVLADMLARFDPERVDLVLAEGFKHAAYPKIEVQRAAHGAGPLYPGDPHIIAVACDGPLAGDHPPALPLDDPEAVADFVLAWLAAHRPDPEPRAELVRYYRWLRHYGYNDSHSGNGSVRDGDGFWVTPSGAGADRLRPEDLIRCPLEGPCAAGASLDAPLHQRVYQRRPEARAVLHSHGAYSVALSISGEDFRPIDFEGGYYFAVVPVLRVPYAEYVAQAPEAVAGALAEHPIAMVAGHGVYAWGETLDAAYKRTCSLELSAKTYVIARQMGLTASQRE